MAWPKSAREKSLEVRSESLAERFWAKVVCDLGSGCWPWTAAPNGRGYGVIGRGGRKDGNVLAHRLSWELHFGSIPAGMDVLHHCDNPPCVRPDHLFLGDQVTNNADRHRKGRTARGEAKKYSAKITEAQVLAIRKRFAERPIVNVRTNRNGPHSVGAIARDYGLNEASVRDIVHRRTWKHLP